MTAMERAILRTIIYSDIFNYPLTKEEIYKYLISEKPISKRSFDEELKKGTPLRGLAFMDGCYFKSNKKRLVNVRNRREKISQKKLLIVRSVCNILQFIPTISFIGISGGLAMENADEKDDIDLFIICK